MKPNRIRRSELATPASSPKMIHKAPTIGADVVFLDLEDACAPSAKIAARGNAIDALNRLDWGRATRAVRVNSLDTIWCHDDVIDIVTGAGANLDVIIVPKARSGRDVWWFDTLLTQLEHKLELPRRIGLEVLIEEAEGLANVTEIATASPRVEAIILGVGDLSASLHARVDTNFEPVAGYPGDFWHFARAAVLTAARIADIDAIDGPYPAYHDAEGYRRSASWAGSLGFDGKWAIHPSQVPIANDTFSPTPDEIDWARTIEETYRVSEESGTGAIGLDGNLVDAAHKRHVRNLLRRAELIEAPRLRSDTDGQSAVAPPSSSRS